MINDELESELNEFRAKGLARRLRVRDTSSLINFSSNDYLGLASDARVTEAAAQALSKFGVGGTASRLIAGTVSVHDEFEKAIARFLAKQAALLFPSGYHVNTGVIPALVSVKDVVFFDRLSHASIIDGVRLSGAHFFAFDHNNTADLEARLKKQRAKGRRALIVTEGIFSMDGDESPIHQIVDLAHRFDTWTYLDEAHSIGVVGPSGCGLAANQHVLDSIDVHVGTLSKTLGSQGGFVAGSQTLIDFLVTRCRSFAYTTALAPAMAAAGLAALERLPSLDDERRELLSHSERIRRELSAAGFVCGNSRSQIIPVLTRSLEATTALSEYLLSKGFFVPSIRPPTVPVGEARVRLSISLPVLKHTDALIKAFKGGPVVARS